MGNVTPFPPGGTGGPRGPRRPPPNPPAQPDKQLTVAERFRAGLIGKAQRRAKIMEFLAAGMSVEDVAKQVGMSHSGVSGIRRAELRKLADVARDQAEELRALDLTRIENAIRAIYGKVLKGELAAVDRLDKLIRTRQSILGNNADGEKQTGDTFVFNVSREDVRDVERAVFGDSIPGEGTDLPPAPELEVTTP